MSASSAAAPEPGARRRARMDPPPRRRSGGTADRPQTSAGLATVVRAVGHGAWLTLALVRDARVPAADKVAAFAALTYLVSPVDLVTDVVPIIGQLDDLALVLWAWRRLLQAAGPDVIEDLWRADEQALEFVLAAAGVDD